MASCEKCWTDTYMEMLKSPIKNQTEYYKDLIKGRNYTLEEQAGENADKCPKCDRNTIHNICKVYMICGYENQAYL